MESLYLIIGLILGAVVGSALAFFKLKSNTISRTDYDQKNAELIKIHTDLENAKLHISKLNQDFDGERNINSEQQYLIQTLQTNLAKTNAENSAQTREIEKQSLVLLDQNREIKKQQEDLQQLISQKSELTAKNYNLQTLLDNQKQEIAKMQDVAKTEFQNLANKILEEKTEKFTILNKENIDNILKPFQEKIQELKNTVHETYEKESKQRFSLGEKVRELAELNQQISDDAKNLTRALKGESKTQGNWGEMILESILEKSGLEKGREYFMEYELRDEDNKALYSEFSGKKMRPDAVIKYPDERNVIIDSKVSLTHFSELVDENDTETYLTKLNLHLNSVKNHIVELSKKAYDDYGKSLDFVMMFIPSEPAYIAAMQADHNLWNFAYERRILLLNPSNLITSLKLIADLWKREYQNRNTLAIADRGAKLYDKFVGFIENLERIGKNIENSRVAYTEAFKQLSSGNDNLILQTQKLKALGIKNKKELPQSLVESSHNNIELHNQ